MFSTFKSVNHSVTANLVNLRLNQCCVELSSLLHSWQT